MGNNAGYALREIGVAAIPALKDALRDRNWKIREGAALVLGDIADPTTRGNLERLLHDPVGHVRWTAVTALGELGDPRALPALQRASHRERRTSVRRALGVTIQKLTRMSPSRDLKGPKAPAESDEAIRPLIEVGKMVEITTTHKGTLIAYKVNYVEGYKAGTTPLEAYKGAAVHLNEFFTNDQQEEMRKWIAAHHIRSPDETEERSVRFRFVLGPWRWLVIVYVHLEGDDRVVVVTIQDGRASRAPTSAR